MFVTLTAPSFGAVHTRGTRPDGRPRRCRPRHDAPVRAHGVRLSCGRVHDEDDPCLGEPICPDCFDHQAAVVWNNALSELWRRTTIYLPRVLARLTGQTHKRLRERVRISYVKVAEYQRRGLVHLHAVIRLDRAMPAYRATEIHPPPAPFGVELLEDAIRATVREVAAPLPDRLDAGAVRWGQELDIRRLDDEARRELAGYLAKYATKSTELAGACFIASASIKSTRSACANTYAATCAPRSRSPPSPRSLIGASPPARTSSATAVTASPRAGGTPPPSPPSGTRASNTCTSSSPRGRLIRRSSRSPAQPSGSRAFDTPVRVTSQQRTSSWPPRRPQERAINAGRPVRRWLTIP